MAEVVVIGAGPAGLIAATYLARFRRSVTVLDGGPPRAFWIPESHNTPGFPDGIGGTELVGRLRAQAREFGARIVVGRAERLARTAGGFEVRTERGGLQGAKVLLATGLTDRKPAIAGLEPAILRSQVRMCPICDGFEAIGLAVAVLGDGERGAREALYLRTYADEVTLLHLGPPLPHGRRRELTAAGVEVAPATVEDIVLAPDEVRAGAVRADCLYLALGCEANSELALALGAAHDAAGDLVVDAHQQTSIEGLYAAGDVVRGLNQITVAGGEAAIAATDIHNRLSQAFSRPVAAALTRRQKTGR